MFNIMQACLKLRSLPNTRKIVLFCLLLTCELSGATDHSAKLREALRGSLREQDYSGTILFEHDLGYDRVRQVENGLCNHRRPLVILRPRSTKDVAAALKMATTLSLDVSVRSGGHGYSCAGIKHGSVQIDLRLLDKVRLLPEVYIHKESGEKYQLAQLGPGSRWSRVLKILPASRYTYVHGQCTGVGVGGFLAGGGINIPTTTARFGSGSQNIEEYTMVMARGEVAKVTADGVKFHNNTLQTSAPFRALKGAGSSFGIVTEFTYRIYLRPETKPVMLSVHLESLKDLKRLELVTRYTRYHVTIFRVSHFRRLSLAPDVLGPTIFAGAVPLIKFLRRGPYQPVLLTVYDRLALVGADTSLADVLKTFRRFRIEVVRISPTVVPRILPSVEVENYDELYLPARVRKAWGPQAILSANALVKTPRRFARFFYDHPVFGLRAGTAQGSRKAAVGCDWCSVVISPFSTREPPVRGNKGRRRHLDLGVNHPVEGDQELFYLFDFTCQYSPLRIKDAVKCKRTVEDFRRTLFETLRAANDPIRQYYNTPSCQEGFDPFWKRYWGEDYPFLLAMKREWDPHNVFNHCHSVNSTSELCCE